MCKRTCAAICRSSPRRNRGTACLSSPMTDVKPAGRGEGCRIPCRPEHIVSIGTCSRAHTSHYCCCSQTGRACVSESTQPRRAGERVEGAVERHGIQMLTSVKEQRGGASACRMDGQRRISSIIGSTMQKWASCSKCVIGSDIRASTAIRCCWTLSRRMRSYSWAPSSQCCAFNILMATSG
eukprot:5622978-Pleurochrysis_carterae.AAC.2